MLTFNVREKDNALVVLRSSENFASSVGRSYKAATAAPPRKSPAHASTAAAISPDGPTQSSSSQQDEGPPRPPRSAFMCFTDAKKKEIMEKRGIVEENDEILNIVAEEWKNLSEKDRAHWDEECRNDKVRYVRAKAAYKGPNMIPKRRAKKHPMAPKRPMSAFLKFSQTRRQRVKKENPDMSNTDVSRLLGEMWRNATVQEKAPYRELEESERSVYKENIKKFKEEQARMDAVSRTSHQSVQGYRHHSYHHPGEDYHHHPPPPHHHLHHPYQRTYTSQPPPPPPVASTFDTLRMDSFDDLAPAGNNDARPGPFRAPYSHSYPAFRQTFSNPPEPVGLHEAEYHDDPLPIASVKIPAMDEQDSPAGRYGAGRSSYFQDHSNVGYFKRYL